LPEQDEDLRDRPEEPRALVRDLMFDKGQSKRIWSELYKVIDSSDIIIQVLDARNPLGTRSRKVEETVKSFGSHKHMIFLLNKCDLVPTWVTRRWVQILSSEHPTLAFHASIDHPFGKGALIQLLRQFSRLHGDKKQICVGFIGYPNVGKSSVINTLRKKKVCKVAPIPGETKVWQYITLFKRIYLIDCPGVVAASDDTETDVVLKGVVRIENLQDPQEHVAQVLEHIKREYITRTYGISEWTDHDDFLKKLAIKYHKLLKKGEPDTATVAKMVLYDWTRGRLPYFYPPPGPNMPSHDPGTATSSGDAEPEKDEAIVTAAKINPLADPSAPASSSSSANADQVQTVVNIQVKQRFSAIKVSSAWDGTTDQYDPSIMHHHSDDEISQSDSEPDVDYDELLQAVEGDIVDALPEPRISTLPPAEEEEGPLAAAAAQGRQAAAAESEEEESDLDIPGFPSSSAGALSGSDDDDSDQQAPRKQKRMTTNKRKIGTHFYDTANVKNRNRSRAKSPAAPATKSRTTAKRPRK
jgi:nuclear GTP-binding protein